MLVNELELRVFGLMRSGSHAIIEWIVSLYPDEKVSFLDNVEHGDHDPYRTCREQSHTGHDPDLSPEQLPRELKRLLVYSYEDRQQLQRDDTAFIDSVFDPAFEEQREQYLGGSREQRNVLILRDPFNCLASRMMLIRKRGARGGMNDMKQIARNWKALARRALDNSGENNDLVILYNHWVGSKTYRKKLAATLGGRYSEESMARLLAESAGEPGGRRRRFRPFRRMGKALRMFALRTLAFFSRSPMPVVDASDDLYSRWRILSRDPEFRELFTDPELLELSEPLFGEIPGTRFFVNRINGGGGLFFSSGRKPRKQKSRLSRGCNRGSGVTPKSHR